MTKINATLQLPNKALPTAEQAWQTPNLPDIKNNQTRSKIMIPAIELLLTAPDEQAIRMKIAYSAIVDGDWEQAAFSLNHAAADTGGDWSSNCRELANFCTRKLAG